MEASHVTPYLGSRGDFLEPRYGTGTQQSKRLLELLCEHFSQERIGYSAFNKFSTGSATHLIKNHFSEVFDEH